MSGLWIRRANLLVCVAATVAAGTGTAAAQAPPPESSADVRSALVDRLFETWDRPDSPGAAVLVMRDGETVHAAGYGMANLEHAVPIRASTVFDIASVSKQFAAFAIAVLAEEGVIGLDDDVRRHIPELPDFGHTITIRHLVHHTSGLRDWPGTLRLAGWDYQDVMSFEQILAMAFNQRELNFPPGTDYAYSNTGYNLMAEIVARATGRSFRDWTRERIFEPLGMGDTHFHDDWTEIVPGRAESYRPTNDGGVRRVVSSLTALGSSSLFTTVEDLARWAKNLDDPVLSAGAVARLTERGVLSNGDTLSYAWGLMVGSHRGATTVSHGGSWAGYRSTFLRFPDHGLTVVILANTAGMNPTALGHRVADLYLAEVLEPEPLGQPELMASEVVEPFALSDAALSELAGEYRSRELDTSYRLIVVDDQLVARHFRTGTFRLRPVAPDLFQAPWFGTVEFIRDDRGQVVAFTATSTRVRGLRFDRIP